jgi:ubiquinone/menaquinone biosynthesis C-methylase UbiE
LYRKSTRYYDALYHFKDYAAAAAQLHELLQERGSQYSTLLDVACGTGKHLEHLQASYRVEGLDINPEMLLLARGRCPEAAFHEASMVEFDLGRTFDVVTCLFSSIAFVKTAENMSQAIKSMARHVSPGGLLVVEPWFSPERYWTGTITANFVDQPELKIAWMYTSERRDLLGVLDIHYLVGTPNGMEHFTELHELGLFRHDEYLRAFQEAGLDVNYDPKGLFGRGMYLGAKSEAV